VRLFCRTIFVSPHILELSFAGASTGEPQFLGTPPPLPPPPSEVDNVDTPPALPKLHTYDRFPNFVSSPPMAEPDGDVLHEENEFEEDEEEDEESFEFDQTDKVSYV
jgi:hypothetical protein